MVATPVTLAQSTLRSVTLINIHAGTQDGSKTNGWSSRSND